MSQPSHGRLPMASLARAPLPRVRRALAQRQRVRLRTHLAALEKHVRAALAGPLAGTPSGRRLERALSAFRGGLITHLRDEAGVLRERAFPRRSLEQLVREHQHCEERIDALWSVLPKPAAGAREPAVLRRLRVAVSRMETALHEQIYAEHEVLFRRLRGLR